MGNVFDATEKEPFDSNLVMMTDPTSFEAEQFKRLRSNIRFPQSGQPPRVIMVTSAVPGEGKSFVAANLAASIARNIDHHVLLMDCDLRLPTIHQLFGLGRPEGLSEYLSGDADLSSLFINTGINNLSILPGGDPPDNPAELLSSEQMAMLIKEVKNRYQDRYIIMDSAPPRLPSETSAIMECADGILLVVNCGTTERDAVLKLVEMLGKDRILGVVFNRFDLAASKYYGYGKYNRDNTYFAK